MKEGWEYKKLGELFPYIKNGANIKQSKDAKGYPITRIETLSSGVFNRDRLGYANIYELGKYEEYVLKSHDLLLSHINSKAYIGRTVEYKAKEGETIIHGMNLLRLKSNFDAINSSYFAYYALSTKFKDDIAKIRKDAVNQSSVAISDLKCIQIPLPPLSEQQSIVAELDKINEIIDLKKAQLKDLDLLAQSIFYEMFGDLFETNQNICKLKDIADYFIGLTYKPDNVSEKGTIVLRSSNIQESQLDFADIVRVDVPVKENKLVKSGDILMCSRNGSARLVGKVARIKELYEDMSFGAFMTIIRSQYNDFLFEFFRSDLFRCQLSTAKTATINQITTKMLDNIVLIIPPMEDVQSFASKIQAIESQKSAIKQSLAEAETLLASRMDYYFN